MPPAVITRDSPEYKCQLLRYILAIKDEFRDREPDYVSFFNYVGKTFDYAGVPLLKAPDELAAFLDHEVHIWTKEADGTPKKRRPGHEEGKEYDLLMGDFVKALDAITLDHWHWVVTQDGPNWKRYSEVPEEYRHKVRRLVNNIGPRIVQPGDARKAAAHVAKMFHASKTERHDFEYDAVKLERVVNSAMDRAREVGKPDLAEAVFVVYQDSLENMELRVLLEKTLLQKTTPQENMAFQDYVRQVKKRLKQEKHDKRRVGEIPDFMNAAQLTQSQRAKAADSLPTKPTGYPLPSQPIAKAAPTIRTSLPASLERAVKAKLPAEPPKVVIAKTEDVGDEKGKGINGGPPSTAPDRLASHHATEDSGYGSAKDGTPSDEGTNGRKAASITSTEAAEQDDLEEAQQRASKRRRRAGSDDSDDYHPSMDNNRRAKSTPKRNRTETHDRSSRESSPLSEHDEVDIEQAKEAYVDEMVRRKSAEAARKAIEDKYGPVSPSIAGDARSEPAESWASMPSPTMEPVRPAAAVQAAASKVMEQATAGAQSSDAHSMRPPPVPAPPPPEGFTPEEGSNAYKLITATVAEAIIPYFNHMETKVDKLESQQKSMKKADTLPSSEELMNAAKALQTGALQSGSPETTQLISQLLKNAADASIHAAEAARKAGEVARNVSEVLMHMASNQENETTTKASSGQKKRR